MVRSRILVAFAFAATLLGAACQPTFVPTVPATACYVGTFTLQGAQFTKSLNTPAGPVTISLLPGGTVTLTTTASTWTLSGTESVSVAGAATGQATANATATGSYTAANGGADFVATLLSGTVALQVTVNGHAVDQTITLPGSWLDEDLQLSGHASYTCSNGGLSLSFSNVHLDF